ncbi:actin cortical patch SUR7/pH-response regulator pali [Mycotypha africana]|uniref:actin cortical patch SUR7/pH-response regulator pali n=1 Tax=Mycotypha africana TaxID=64632 RepID=UPI002300EE50|nr:actin cortical patch SUR7/pH-response regulator pali [Mycotypha africana]KAI8975277.1 actin cortical patch SUR7/pH-response regulator pali [Mycotypha africana]
MSRFIQTIIILLILASFLLQILVMLGNFKGLRSLYIAKIDVSSSATDSGSILGDLWNKAKGSALNIPQYITVALFLMCERNNTFQTSCTPPSFGFTSTAPGILGTLLSQIPDSAHKTLMGVQGGVFILSAILSLFLLIYMLLHCCTTRKNTREYNACHRAFIFVLFVVALAFAIATFAVQYAAFGAIKMGIEAAKSKFLPSSMSSLVNLNTHTGNSIWVSLVAFILLLIATILMSFVVFCCGRRKGDSAADEFDAYEMERVRDS